jgi:HPt (histidine-containing phosphotransfer) domain-containing protein
MSMNTLGKPIMDDSILKPSNQSEVAVTNEAWQDHALRAQVADMASDAIPGDYQRKQAVAAEVSFIATTDAMDFDKNALLDRLSGDLDLATKVVQAFVNETEGLISKFGQALAREDVYAAQLLAHSIKGSSGTVGCHRLQGVARHAEDYCRDGRLEDARSADVEFTTAFAQVESALRKSGFLYNEAHL